MMSYTPLTRSKTSRIIAGVCGGLGEYFNIDPTLLRIFFCILFFAGGAGIAIYLLLWIIIPEAESKNAKKPIETSEEIRQHIDQLALKTKAMFHPSRKKTVITAFICIALGAAILADRFLPQFSLIDFWPILLIAAGLFLLYTAFPFRGAESQAEQQADQLDQTNGE